MPKVTKEPTEPTRKSSRSAGVPAPAPAAAKPASKKAAAPKKAKDAEKDAEAAMPSPAISKLEVGDVLPELTLQNEKGEDVDVSKIAGEKGLVLFVYPKADTPGCTTQACSYRDSKDDITSAGYTIYGLSKDKPAAQAKWIEKKSLTYSLLSDPSSKLLNALGASKRSHFIFEKGTGKLVEASIGVKPADDVANVLAFIKKHHA
ncbi:thioredoxin-like protein [Mrakia frigida]|uniref:thioredoxin peroxidase DOT5 n=1 Tax=Mrakia frigida TaxID=29902 RepID=UPI003FCC068A